MDPTDGKVHVRFVMAPALQAAGHVPAQQPYFFVALRNLTTGATLYTDFNYANNPGVPWKSQGAGNLAVLYTDWVITDIAPGNVALRVGDTIELQVSRLPLPAERPLRRGLRGTGSAPPSPASPSARPPRSRSTWTPTSPTTSW